MKVELLEDYDSNLNDNFYTKGQLIEVVQLDSFNDSYVVYRYGGLDWIPKDKVKII